MSNQKTEELAVKSIESSLLPIIRQFYWEGRLKVWLAKGYVVLKLTDEEKKRLKLSELEITRIEEILQEKIDQTKINKAKNLVLQMLATVDTIKIPNYETDENEPLISTLTQITPDITETISTEMQTFLPLLANRDYQSLNKALENWKRRFNWSVFKKSAEILVQIAHQENISIEHPSYDQFRDLPANIQPFILLLGYYDDPKPNNAKIDLYRQLLLLRQQNITNILDFIIFVSWRNYPEKMYTLTESWITSLNATLVSWLIHGVEVPGRSNAKKALRFIKPTITIRNDDVEWLISHVIGQIIGASPYEALQELETWLIKDLHAKMQACIENALHEVIKDKILDGNVVKEDFPDLKEVIRSIMQMWIETGTEMQDHIANKILNTF